MWDLGGRVCMGKKPSHSKDIRLAEKAERSWKAFAPMGEQVCQQSSPAKGRPRGKVSKEQRAWPFPSIACMSLCSLGSACMDGVRSCRRMCSKQHGSSRPGQAAPTVGVAATQAH